MIFRVQNILTMVNNAHLITLSKNISLTDTAIHQNSIIVRGADTDRFDLAPQAAGLWAISAGLSYNYKDDHEMLNRNENL